MSEAGSEPDQEKRVKAPLLGIACLLALMGSSLAQSPPMARATFVDAKGQQVGSATLTQMTNGILIAIDMSGLPAGEHGFHIHETGKCESNTKFESAGDHYGLQGQKHGHQSECGPQAGDMPNQFVGPDGKLRAHVINPDVTLGSGQGSLFDQDGSAILIHAKADDYRSQPSGEAGDRLACAVVAK
jgi:superoxide dismutase, Cu-Zn family